jgi:hypothetical protein
MFIAKNINFCAEFFRSLVFPGIFLSDGCSQVEYVNTANFKFNTFLNWTQYSIKKFKNKNVLLSDIRNCIRTNCIFETILHAWVPLG